MIVGLAGLSGSGKTTIAKYFCKNDGFCKKSFADYLKNMLITAGMITYEEAYIQKTKESRRLLQKIGTEIFRNQVDKYFWVDKMNKDISKILSFKRDANIIIDDIRFLEEIELIRLYNGKVIWIEGQFCQLDDELANHESENKLIKDMCDMIVMQLQDCPEATYSLIKKYLKTVG